MDGGFNKTMDGQNTQIGSEPADKTHLSQIDQQTYSGKPNVNKRLENKTSPNTQAGEPSPTL